MSILHFNNRDYKIRKYDVYEEEDSVITQFVAEVILPDNLKTPEVRQFLIEQTQMDTVVNQDKNKRKE